jgi:quercetin dioxygenase-like cupin family protein
LNNPEFPNSVALVRIVPDGDGPAFFEEAEIPLQNTHAHGAESEVYPAQEISFVWTPPDFALDFHTASRRRIIVVLDGQMEIEDGKGECRLFGAGDMIDILDTTGKGHKTRVVGGREMHTALIEIGDKIRPDWPLLEAAQHRTFAFTRAIAGSDGGSQFVDETLTYNYDAPLGEATAPMALEGYQFVFKPGSLDHGFHNAPQRQFVLNLTSGMQVETSNGMTRNIHPGDIFLGDDTTGTGHKTRAINASSRLSIFAHLLDR